jgi:hypothetical protein
VLTLHTSTDKDTGSDVRLHRSTHCFQIHRRSAARPWQVCREDAHLAGLVERELAVRRSADEPIPGRDNLGNVPIGIDEPDLREVGYPFEMGCELRRILRQISRYSTAKRSSSGAASVCVSISSRILPCCSVVLREGRAMDVVADIRAEPKLERRILRQISRYIMHEWRPRRA